jgi:hypothetical protein
LDLEPLPRKLVGKFRTLLGEHGELYIAVSVIYLVGYWFHYPYGGGHIYSDIVTVFQTRLCQNVTNCPNGIPYVQSFVEYPVLAGMFMYAMGDLGKFFPLNANSSLIDNYYNYTSIFFLVPTFLLVEEILKISHILGIKHSTKRTFLYLVATPSFIFMLLLNWYIIGVYFAVYGLRKFLQGSRVWSGVLLGLSAAANLVTAAPALGMILNANSMRERLYFALGIGAAFGVVNLPFLILNHGYFLQFLNYHENWYIEGSWMLAVLTNTDPLRHYIFVGLFAFFSAMLVWEWRDERKRASSDFEKSSLTVRSSWLFTFAFLFSTYVCTPQMNIMLLPFFVLAAVTASYWEFLAFDIVNALVIVWGFSQPLLIFGISLTVLQFGPIWQSPIQALAVIRSIWIGKFLIFDGMFSSRRFSAKDLVGTGGLNATLQASWQRLPRLFRLLS